MKEETRQGTAARRARTLMEIFTRKAKQEPAFVPARPERYSPELRLMASTAADQIAAAWGVRKQRKA